MGFWLFGGRKNRRDDKTDKHGPGGAASHEKMAHHNSSKTHGSQRHSERRPNRLTKRDRSIGRDPNTTQPRSFTAPQATRNSTFPPTTHLREKSDTFPTPPANPFISPTEHFSNDVYQHNPASQSSIGQDLFSVGHRPPTLNAKRSSQDAGMPRRKTSKRRAEERQREKEIKQMSSPVTISKRSSLPAGLLRQDTKKIRGGLNRHLDRPTSDVSLPVPESLSDSVDEMPEHQHSFKVKTFDILAPRPTVRYTENPRYRPSRSTTHSRTSEKRPTIPEEEYKSRRRIEDLADGFDASALRELMERDRRRKEKKQVEDQQKLDRRLQRRADRQRQQEQQQASAAAGPSSPSKATGARARHERPSGLGIAAIEDARGVKQEAKEPTEPQQLQTPESWLHDPSKENVAVEDPFADAKAVPEPEKPHGVTADKPLLRTESPADVRMSQTSIATGSPPRSPAQKPRDRSSMSQMSGLQREYTPDIPEHREVSATRRASDQSGGHASSWASFFKRGTTRHKRPSVERGRATPSEFSNTSRESFARQGPPPTMPNRTFRRSSTPIRTQSKFREDLPDFPLSPPDSRVQSPEAVAVPSNRSSDAMASLTAPESSRHGEGDLGVHQEATIAESPKIGRSAVMSQSLASVDSEASWLSGRPAKRASLGMAHPLRQSETSLQQKDHAPGEEDDLANDEYLNRLSPAPESRRDSAIAGRRASSTILGHAIESDEEGEALPTVPRIPGSYLDEPGTKLHGGAGRRPTLVSRQDGIKSREGLLNEFDADSSDEFDDEDIVTSEEHPVKKTHLRHVSGGSARLLDVRRTSLDSSKRLSSVEAPTSQRASIHSPDS